MTQASNTDAGYPLSGLKVLDFSRVLAGPFAGRMLCDLGADVVKVEPPDGDITRLWGAVIADLPGYFSQQNAGKRNICIDLRAEGARDLVFELVRSADILIENYRPDVMPRLGLGYAELAAVNPQLIMLSISGFGRDGPESDRPAYAPVVHAETGLIGRQARRGNIPYRDLPLSVADTNASLHGLVGVLAAVIHRQTTGKGQHIDIAMVDTVIVTDDQIQYDLEDSEDTGPLPNDIWETGVGPILVSGDFRWLWRMCTAEHGFIEDPTTPEMDLQTKIETRRAKVAEFFASLDSWDAIEQVMATMNVAWGHVRDPVDIRQQRTVQARGTIIDIDDRAGGTRPIPQSPYRFSSASAGVRGPARHRGEDNRSVMADWLGKTDLEIDGLLETGVLDFDEGHAV